MVSQTFLNEASDHEHLWKCDFKSKTNWALMLEPREKMQDFLPLISLPKRASGAEYNPHGHHSIIRYSRQNHQKINRKQYSTKHISNKCEQQWSYNGDISMKSSTHFSNGNSNEFIMFFFMMWWWYLFVFFLWGRQLCSCLLAAAVCAKRTG